MPGTGYQKGPVSMWPTQFLWDLPHTTTLCPQTDRPQKLLKFDFSKATLYRALEGGTQTSQAE